jgi:hypothetical protein
VQIAHFSLSIIPSDDNLSDYRKKIVKNHIFESTSRMNNGAKERRNSRRRGCRRNRKMNQRGGAGEAYTLGSFVAGAPIINNYGQEIVRFPSCEEAVRPGYLEGAQIKGGLPGFAGGGKKRKGSRKIYRGGAATPGSPFPQTYASETSTYVPPANGYVIIPNPVPGATNTVSGAAALATSKIGGSMSGFRGGVLETGADQVATQMGGRYGFDAAVVGESAIAIPGRPYTGCGTGMEALSDPFNKVQATSLITAPPPSRANYMTQFGPMSGGRKSRKSGRKGRKQNGGVGGVDSMFYDAPRAGYTHAPSNGAGGSVGSTLSDGRTPFLLNVPYSAQVVPSPNCLKTGGRRKSSRSARRKSSRSANRKSRKNRKGSRSARRKN